MRVQELSLATAFRYLSAGVSAWAYLAVLDWPTARTIIKWPFLVGGGIGATALLAVITLALGTLIYFLYRALFFEFVVLYFDDAFRWWTDNYRTWLSMKYRLTLRESQALADLLGENIKDRVPESLARAHAGTHLLYISGFIGIVECLILRVEPNPFWLRLPNSTLPQPQWWQVLVFAGMCLVAAFFQGRHQENHELLQFKHAFKPRFLDELVVNIELDRSHHGNWFRWTDRLRFCVRENYPRKRYGNTYQRAFIENDKSEDA